MKTVDLVGLRKGRFTVIARAGTKIRGKNKIKKEAIWLCKCDCGNEFITTTSNIKHGNCNSCGCYRVEFMLNIRENGTLKGVSKNHWKELMKKCNDPKDRRYYLYGGRGITICDEWKDFEKFYTWVKSQTNNPNYSIALKDKHGIYEPNNCCIMPKIIREKTKVSRMKKCNVSKEEWEKLVRGVATIVLNDDECYDYFKKHEPFPYVLPNYAAKVLDMSMDTFKKYARKYLMPEIYGELPENFFDPSENNCYRKKLPKLM